MELYIHHVGGSGADEDFPKTVFKEIPISTVEQNIPPSVSQRDQILRVLRYKFPSGTFNCWGVPPGARYAIRHLTEGDIVLLAERARPDGRVPVLCEVQAFWPFELSQLSQALWGDPDFPFIFYFRTEEIVLTWPQLVDDLGYAPDYNPRGTFNRFAQGTISGFGSVENYVAHLRRTYAKKAFDPVSQNELHGVDDTDVAVVNHELSEINHLLMSSPQLTEDITRRTPTSRRARSAAFRIAVKRAYDYRCAVCGSKLYSPDHIPEVEAAHIYPKANDGSDDPRNGICLCRRHHWAFDAGWFALTNDFTVVVHDDLPDDGEYEFIRKYQGIKIYVPVDSACVPDALFLEERRKLMGY